MPADCCRNILLTPDISGAQRWIDRRLKLPPNRLLGSNSSFFPTFESETQRCEQDVISWL